MASSGHWSLVTGHWSLVTGHWSLVTGHFLFTPAVTALTPAVFFHRRCQIFLVEIRPEFRRDVHFGVGSLPEQKIRQPHLAGSSNQQIRIGIIPGVKMFAEHLDVDHPFIDVTELDGPEQAFDAIDN